MRALLDTHAFLWWIGDDPKLSRNARATIADGANEIYFSAASAWEIAIKASLGRLRVADDLAAFVSRQVEHNGFRKLPIDVAHALETHGLSNHHRDPFDRVLAAQARYERMPLISCDGEMKAFGIEVIW